MTYAQTKEFLAKHFVARGYPICEAANVAESVALILHPGLGEDTLDRMRIGAVTNALVALCDATQPEPEPEPEPLPIDAGDAR